MQEKEAYKTRYENPLVGGNDIGVNPSENGNSLGSNPSADGFGAPGEYNNPNTGRLKSSVLSLASLKKALQLVVTILGTSIVGFGLIFSNGSSYFKAAVEVVSTMSDFVCCSVAFEEEEETETIEGAFELRCESRHTTRYSNSLYFEEIPIQNEFSFSGLEPNTEYVLKLYKDGKLISKKVFKTPKADAL